MLMGLSLVPLLALADVSAVSASVQDAPPPREATSQPQVRRVVIRDQLIIRIPVRARQSRSLRYTLSDGPQCLDSADIAGARLAGSRTIDFMLKDRSIIRMRTDRECPSLDFYGGFYLQPRDNRVCARRDAIRTRMGSSCQIETFQRVLPSGSAR
ncbi:hypothetical protein WJS89_11575 [Sphingomicrobium sp. XHP0235]|uniref:hypothetical protein n=1 Tax=Sphingomicrobium aquimarinum TaxID=3133971 RepID=UPI0031FE7EA8